MYRSSGISRGVSMGDSKLLKRKAELSPSKKGDIKKRSALGDLTNAAKKKVIAIKGKPTLKLEPLKEIKKKVSTTTIATAKIPPALRAEPLVVPTRVTRSRSKSLQTTKTQPEPAVEVEHNEDDILYKTAVQTPEKSEAVKELNRKNKELTQETKAKLPEGVVDFDNECGDDPFQVGVYAQDIFNYYLRRELRFPTKKYLEKQTELNKNMRSILVDWMVEVQENFELNHETLYMGVKLVDLFLGRVLVKRDKLQLVGTTALYIASKFDERSPPIIDDFCYICDDAYPQKDVHSMERRLLKALNFDIGFPLSYRFLRRFARCGKIEMDVLTLARYFLEMCLMEYDLVDVKDSLMASAVLFIAIKMKIDGGCWTPTLEFYSGYKSEDLIDLANRIINVVRQMPAHLKTIRAKYSHSLFHEVAKLPLPEILEL